MRMKFLTRICHHFCDSEQKLPRSDFRLFQIADLLSEVSTVLKLVLVLPATDAQSERIFSSLKNVKTYRRNSMGQSRLNHMTMYVHED